MIGSHSLVIQYFLDSKKCPTSQLLFEYNSLNLSATVCSTKLLRRCRHPRVPVKSPSSTCCRPTTFFWCGSRVDAIELLLFRGQNSIKKQSSTTLAATTLAVLTVLYYAILIPNLPPAENDFCLHCLQSTLLLLPYYSSRYL